MKRLMIALIATIALLGVMGCGASREAMRSSESTELRSSELRSSDVKDCVVIEQMDTLREITTVTIDRNEAGDTLRLSRVTERDRIRDRAQERSKEVEIKVVRDTVFIEKRDSVDVKNHSPTSGAGSSGGFVASLRWIFWIIVAIGGLIIVIKVSRIIRI